MDVIDSLTIARNIREIRIANGLSQKKFAERLNYSLRQIRRLEKSGTMNINVINAIAVTFNVSVKGILFDENTFYYVVRRTT